jgi:hypothetical protein
MLYEMPGVGKGLVSMCRSMHGIDKTGTMSADPTVRIWYEIHETGCQDVVVLRSDARTICSTAAASTLRGTLKTLSTMC